MAITTARVLTAIGSSLRWREAAAAKGSSRGKEWGSVAEGTCGSVSRAASPSLSLVPGSSGDGLRSASAPVSEKGGRGSGSTADAATKAGSVSSIERALTTVLLVASRPLAFGAEKRIIRSGRATPSCEVNSFSDAPKIGTRGLVFQVGAVITGSKDGDGAAGAAFASCGGAIGRRRMVRARPASGLRSTSGETGSVELGATPVTSGPRRGRFS